MVIGRSSDQAHSVIYDDSYIDPGLLFLIVDGNSGSNTTLVQNTNTTMQAASEYVGEVDKGTYTQGAGTNFVRQQHYHRSDLHR